MNDDTKNRITDLVKRQQTNQKALQNLNQDMIRTDAQLVLLRDIVGAEQFDNTLKELTAQQVEDNGKEIQPTKKRR